MIQPCDAGPGSHDGAAIHISKDGGKTWQDPWDGKPLPEFKEGNTGSTIAGIHAGVVQLKDGSLMALARGNSILNKEGKLRMPMSISKDMGKTWTYYASEFPPIDGGQRLVFMRLNEGPLLLISFTDHPLRTPEAERGLIFPDREGNNYRGYGLYAAVSYDEVAYLFGDGSMSPYTAEEIAQFVAILEPEWKGTRRFSALEEAAENASRLAVGEKYVDAEFYDLDGNKVMLSSLVPEGRITMLEFWASWCGPCRGEIPHLKHIHKKYPEFDIISISVDDSVDEWKKAVREENMDWIQLRDVSMMDGNAMKLYGVMGIPCCIILDEQGRFFKTNMRGAYLDAFLRDYYGR